MVLQKALLFGCLVVLVAAPLPFGSVQSGASTILVVACLLLGVLWVAWRARRGVPALPWREPAILAWLLVAGVIAFQLVPLPHAMLETLSPRAADMRARFEPAPGMAARGVAAPAEPKENGADSVAAPAAPADPGRRPISLDPHATWTSLLRFTAFFVMALIVLDLAAFQSARHALVRALVAGGAFQALYGLAEYLSGRQEIFGYVKKHYTDVATGTFINRNHYAGYLEMTLPFAIALAAAACAGLRSGASGARRLEHASGRPAFRAALLLVLSLTMATALVCSRSRMGIASALAALLLVGAGLAWRGRGRSFAVAAFVIAAVTLVLFSQGGAGDSIARRFGAAAVEFGGTMGRRQIWAQAWDVARAFPWLGTGSGTFASVASAFRTSGAGVGVTHAHNDFLELAAEMGLAGCLAVAAAVLIVGRSVAGGSADAAKVQRGDPSLLGPAAAAGVLAILFHSLTDFNLAIPANALTWSALLGFTLWWRRTPMLVTSVPAPAAAASPGAKPWPAGATLAGATLAAAALAAGLVLPRHDPERFFGAAGGQAAAAMEDLRVLVSAGDEAAPSSEAATYVESRLTRAAAVQAQGLSRRPTSAAGHVQMGQILLARCAAAGLVAGPVDGCLREARAEMWSALALAPMSATIHANVARIFSTAWPVLDEEGRAEAADIIARARALNPRDAGLRQMALAPDAAAAGEAQ